MTIEPKFQLYSEMEALPYWAATLDDAKTIAQAIFQKDLFCASCDWDWDVCVKQSPEERNSWQHETETGVLFIVEV